MENNFGLQLKIARTESGVSQKDMAVKYGCSPQAIRNIEKSADISTRIMTKYLACLGKAFDVVIRAV